MPQASNQGAQNEHPYLLECHQTMQSPRLSGRRQGWAGAGKIAPAQNLSFYPILILDSGMRMSFCLTLEVAHCFQAANTEHTMELRNIMGATRINQVYVTRHASSKRQIPGLKLVACAGTTEAGSG